MPYRTALRPSSLTSTPSGQSRPAATALHNLIECLQNLRLHACRCGPCQLMSPQLEKAATHFGERCRFLKIDSDEEPDVASILKINGLPTILFINDMSVVARAEGMLMADELLQLAEHHFFGGEKPCIDGGTI